MTMAIGELVSGGTAGSVLFVGASSLLAQDNLGLFFDSANDTLKSRDRVVALASLDLSISTGDILAAGAVNSGALALDTGAGSSNTGSGAAGSSGNASVSTGSGGAADSGAAGNSGNLLLKTGSGGTSNTGAAGSGGDIMLQPGTSGGGSGGSGGRTLVRAPINSPGIVFAVQNDSGSLTYWSVTNAVAPGTLTGTSPFSLSHNSTSTNDTLFVNGSGAKTGSYTAMNTSATATSSTNGVIKTALSVVSTGTWNGTNAENRALYVNATGGPADTNYAGYFDNGDVVLNTGRMGLQVVKPTARLHLAAGSASAGTAAFKLNAGAKLSTPEVGAVEFDGTNAFITRSNGRRRLLTNNLISVLEFGAVGDGTTDDGPAFQLAAAALFATGGSIYVPPYLCYAIATVVVMRSYYPIYFISEMQNPAGFYSTNVPHEFGYIRPTATFIDGMFVWREPVVEPEWSIFNGGGGMIGIAIADVDPANGDVRQFDITNGAVFMRNALTFKLERCNFWYLKGSAVRTNQCVNGELIDVTSQRCGDSSKPSFHFGDGEHFNGLYIDGMFSQTQFLAPHIKGETGAGVNLRDCYFENDSTVGGIANQTYVVGTGNLYDCTFNFSTVKMLELSGDNTVLVNSAFNASSTITDPFVTHSGNDCTFSNLQFLNAPLQGGPALSASGQFCRFTNILFRGCGNFDVGQNNIASDIYAIGSATTESHVLKVGDNSSLVNCNVNTANANVSGILATGIVPRVQGCLVTQLSGTSKGIECTSSTGVIIGNAVYDVGSGGTYVLTRGTEGVANYGDYTKRNSISIPLANFRKVDGAGDVPNSAANGGVLASDTTPLLRGDANQAFEIVWAAGNQDRIAASVVMPQGYYADTEYGDVVVELLVRTDNSGGGAIEAATFTVRTTWNGNTQVTDTATDSAPATTLHSIQTTVANADIADAVTTTLTINLEPAAHANDPVQLLGVKILFRRNLTV